MKHLLKLFQVGTFLKIGTPALVWAQRLAALFLILGYGWVFFIAPVDVQQGNLVTIMYLHVPCAWLGVMCYGVVAVFCGIYLVGRLPLSYFLARASAIVGITFTAVCLVTGSLWGINSWGTWWVWDARLTSVLILFFLYLAFLMIGSAHGPLRRSATSSSLVALIGIINLPIIKWSVTWWATLHQPPSFMKLDKPSIDPSMLIPLLICTLGWCCYAVTIVLLDTFLQLKKRTHGQ